jgi:hypothetical protein
VVYLLEDGWGNGGRIGNDGGLITLGLMVDIKGRRKLVNA